MAIVVVTYNDESKKSIDKVAVMRELDS